MGNAELQATLNRLAGTVGLDAQGAANVWAGTDDLDLVGALNRKAGVWGMELNGVCQLLASQLGSNNGLDSPGAIGSIGAGYLNLTANAGTDHMRVTSTVNFTPVTTLELLAYVSLDDWTPAAANTVLDCNNGRIRFRVDLTTGRLAGTIIGGAGTSTYTASAAPTVSDGGKLWIKLAINITTNVGTFSTSTSAQSTSMDSVVFTQLGTPISAATVPTTVTAVTNMYAGANSLSGAPMDGKFYKARIVSNGTTVASPDVTDSSQFVAGATSGTDPQGNVWTKQGNATFVAA